MFWIQFLISGLIIVFSGVKLTRYADVISDRLGWGKVWIGIVLLGFVTSLPEAVTSFVSIIYLDANNLAIGNLLGSNMFNPMILVILDICYRKGGVTNAVKANRAEVISGIFAIILTGTVMLEIFFSTPQYVSEGSRGGLGGVLICIIYFIGMRILSKQEQGMPIIRPILSVQKDKSNLRAIFLKAFVASVVIVVASIWLSQSADMIAAETGLGRTFVGSIFLAFATSLPEIVVSVSALKLGALDMAIGNIFGSNMTNMFIVFLCGLLKTDVHILSTVTRIQSFTALISILLCGIILWGISKKKKAFFGIGLDSIVMIVVFIVGMRVLYLFR